MSKSIQAQEWALKNYLNKHNIYKDDSDMQTIIINSFYNEHITEKFNSNDDEWQHKIKYVQEHFSKFARYAQNVWKKKQDDETEKCPECGSLTVAKMAGGIECSNKKCNWWFCY